MIWVQDTPSMPGIRISIKITSGFALRTERITSLPSATVSITSISWLADSTIFKLSRISSWSSAMTIFILSLIETPLPTESVSGR